MSYDWTGHVALSLTVLSFHLSFAHLSEYTLFAPPKLCIGIVFNFSWDLCNTQGK